MWTPITSLASSADLEAQLAAQEARCETIISILSTQHADALTAYIESMIPQEELDEHLAYANSWIPNDPVYARAAVGRWILSGSTKTFSQWFAQVKLLGTIQDKGLFLGATEKHCSPS